MKFQSALIFHLVSAEIVLASGKKLKRFSSLHLYARQLWYPPFFRILALPSNKQKRSVDMSPYVWVWCIATACPTHVTVNLADRQHVYYTKQSLCCYSCIALKQIRLSGRRRKEILTIHFLGTGLSVRSLFRCRWYHFEWKIMDAIFTLNG